MTRRYHWRCYACDIDHQPAPTMAEARRLADLHDASAHRGRPVSAFGWALVSALEVAP